MDNIGKKYVVATCGSTYRCFTREQFYQKTVPPLPLEWEAIEWFNDIEECKAKCIEELEMQRQYALDEITAAENFGG